MKRSNAFITWRRVGSGGSSIWVTKWSEKDTLFSACNSEVEVLPRTNHHASSFTCIEIYEKLSLYSLITWGKMNLLPWGIEGWRLSLLFVWDRFFLIWCSERETFQHWCPFERALFSLGRGENAAYPILK